MLDWWFKFFETTQHIKWWHPHDHVEHRGWDSHWRRGESYVGASIHAVESLADIPPVAARLKFHDPAEAFGDARLRAATEAGDVSAAVYARIGFGDHAQLDAHGDPLDGDMVHLARDTPFGCVLRSRFYLGKSSAQPERDAADELGLALLRHCYTEFTYLSRFLPSIYYGEHGNGEKPRCPGRRQGVDPAAGVCYAASFLPSSPPAMRGNPDARQGAIALHGFYFLYYGLQGVSIPFLPLWFAERGLDSAFIGLIVATALLPKILSTPVVAHVADQTGRAHALIAAALIGSLLLYACYPLAATPAWLFAVTLLLNAVFPSVLPLLDRMAIASGRGQGNSYTLIRACGSLGFALMTVSGGYLIKTHGVNWVMWLPMLMIVACLAMLRLLPGPRGPRRTPRPRRRASRPCAPCCATARCCCASPPPRWCRPATASCIPIRRCTGRPRACPPR